MLKTFPSNIISKLACKSLTSPGINFFEDSIHYSDMTKIYLAPVGKVSPLMEWSGPQLSYNRGEGHTTWSMKYDLQKIIFYTSY